MSEQDEAVALFFELIHAHMQSAHGQGWVRAVRMRQGLQAKQLAARMRVSPARISVLEKDEQRGAVTLKMMQKAAQALGCNFVYAFIPKALPQGAKPRVRVDVTATRRASGRRPNAFPPKVRHSKSKKTTE